LQVPSMIHKITYDLTQRRRSLWVHLNVEMHNTIWYSEDIVSSLWKHKVKING
jgi:hypothetical protein